MSFLSSSTVSFAFVSMVVLSVRPCSSILYAQRSPNNKRSCPYQIVCFSNVLCCNMTQNLTYIYLLTFLLNFSHLRKLYGFVLLPCSNSSSISNARLMYSSCGPSASICIFDLLDSAILFSFLLG